MRLLWQLWKQHEGTKLLLLDLKARRAGLVEELAGGSSTYPTIEATALKTAEYVARIDELDTIIEIASQGADEDEPESNQDRA